MCHRWDSCSHMHQSKYITIFKSSGIIMISVYCGNEQSDMNILIWMFLPKIHMLKPSLQCDGIRTCGLWEVIRSWGWSPYGWSMSPYNEDSREFYWSFHHMRTLSEDGHLWSAAHQTQNLPALWSWISQSLELREICFCCLLVIQSLVL